MPLVKVKAIAELPPGSLTQIEINGAPFALCNFDGTLHCLDGTCPHAGGPLGEGNLDGANIVCPWHSWSFDCRTGVNDFDEDLQLTKYPVTQEDGHVWVELP